MSIEDRKSKERDRLKAKILDAALHVFSEQGYARVSMRRIAARIDYSPTTIYRFFRNKEDLLTAIAGETYGDLAARFERVKAEYGDRPLEMLKLLVKEYIIFCVERPEMFKMFSDLVSFEMEGGIMYERLGDLRFEVFQSWFHGIRQAIASGALELKDERRVFLYLWDASQGYVDHRIRHARVPREPLTSDSANYLNLIFAGIEANRGQ
ncbi:MAG: TetR/AcrR family transcriptional regulator [Longimicrobiales bacterium]|nr:TetR/AcrR family transcriptional regulator [Longimicrobiales bacterium]